MSKNQIPECPIHHRELVCPSCRAALAGAGKKGKTSKLKARTSRRNGRRKVSKAKDVV